MSFKIIMDSINNSNLSLNDSLDSNASFCLSEPDSNPQAIDVVLRNGSPLFELCELYFDRRSTRGAS